MDLEKLKELREDRDYNRLSFSIKIGMPPSTYYDKENGKTSFKVNEVEKIAENLKLSKEEIIELLNL